MIQVAKCLPSRHKVLSSNPCIANNGWVGDKGGEYLRLERNTKTVILGNLLEK
jgi:hypothetical protein